MTKFISNKLLILFIFCFSIQIFLVRIAKAHHNPTFGLAGTSGPIITNPASTIPKGHWGVGIRSEYANLNEYSRDALKYFAKKKQFVHGSEFFLSPAVVAAFGATDNLTLGIRYPYSIQSGINDGALSGTGMAFVIHRGTSDGLGDLTLFGQYRFLNLEEKQLESAILTGLSIPSGLAHVKDKTGERFGADHQPSRRAFEPLLGLSITKHFGPRISFDTNYLFTKAVKGIQNFYSGDLHNYNLALSYQLIQPHHHHHSHSNENEHSHKFGAYSGDDYSHEHSHKHKWYSIFGLDTIMELNGEWRQKQKFGTLQPFGFIDEDSGGSTVYLSPGIRLNIKDKWSTYFSYGHPLIHDPSGDGQKTDFRMIFGLSRSF